MQTDKKPDNLFGDGSDPGISVDSTTGAVTVVLKHHVKVGTETVEQITLRRPRGRDLENMDKQTGTWSILLYLIDQLNDTNVAAFSKLLDVEDINRTALVVADFFGGSLKTGEML